jgi:Tfp pilus assembly PilM family ATPase/Tfp pilus assembly protein PilN
MGNKGAKVARSVGKPRKSVVLVEIGNDWIKLIQAEASKNGVTLSKVHLEPIDSDVSISDSIASALKAKKFSTASVLACLPRQAVNLRLLELPSTDGAEIADMVELQIGRQTPYSRDEILSDYKQLGRTRQGTYTRIMLAIVQRSIVRERFYEIEQAGLDIERMGVSSEGVLNWFLHRTPAASQDKVQALIDVDSFYSHMLVLQHGKVIFTKSILVGAKQLLESREESISQFTQEVQSALQSCRGDLRDAEIEAVTLSGAGVHVDGLVDGLSESLSLPCEGVDCLADVKLGKGSGDLGDARYATASLTALIGMALNPSALDFDFVPDVVRMRKTLLHSAFSCTALGALVMTAMVAASLYAILACSFRSSRLDALTAETERTSPAIVRIERMLEVIRETNERQDSRFAMVNLLPAIHRSVPKDVYFESVDIDAESGKSTLAGTAPSRKDIRDLLKMLSDLPLFGDVSEDGRVTMDTDGRFKFKVEALFQEDE